MGWIIFAFIIGLVIGGYIGCKFLMLGLEKSIDDETLEIAKGKNYDDEKANRGVIQIIRDSWNNALKNSINKP